MSSHLRVWIKTSTYDPDLREGVQVVGNIYSTGAGRNSHRGVIFPLGGHVKPAAFEVDAGSYIVEATLPSGEMLLEEIDVAEGKTATLGLEAPASPYETHAWQSVLGNVEPYDTYHSKYALPIPRSAGSRYVSLDRADESAFDRTDILETPPTPPPEVTWLFDDRPQGPSFAVLNDAATLPPLVAAAQLQNSLRVLQMAVLPERAAEDAKSYIYRFVEHEPPTGFNVLAYRQFLIIRDDRDAYLVTLPCPWRNRLQNEAIVEVMVNAKQSPTGSPIAVTVRDTSIGAGLAYMANGALAQAAAVFKDAQEMLYDKMVNPLAAAAGGYVMIGTDPGNERKPWDNWLDNLRHMFPYMSDGSILWAVRHLRLARSENDVEEARLALLEACDRGLPVYTLGLSWLIETLSEFPEDEKCAHMLQQIRRLSWHVDMREPFVILRLNGNNG